VCDANEGNEPVVRTTAGRSGTWRTVIANWRVEKVCKLLNSRLDRILANDTLRSSRDG
jgi:hypothetical protein